MALQEYKCDVTAAMRLKRLPHSHRIVKAGQVASIEDVDGLKLLRFEGSDVTKQESAEWVERFQVAPGTWWIEHQDGVHVAMDAIAFERIYSLVG